MKVAFTSGVLATFCLTASLVAPASADDPLKRFSIDLIPSYTLSTNGDQNPPNLPLASQLNNTNTFRLSGRFTAEIAKGSTIYYDRQEVPFQLGRVSNVYTGAPAGAPVPTAVNVPGGVYTGALVDRFETYAFQHDFNSTFAVEGGYFRRSRYLGAYPDGSQNPGGIYAAYGGPFVGIIANFVKVPHNGPLFTFTARGIEVRHNSATDATLAEGVLPSGGYPPGTVVYGDRPIGLESLTVHIPTNHLFFPFVEYLRAMDYFNNEPSPETQNVFIYGFAIPVHRDVIFHAVAFNLHETAQGETFPTPDAVKVTNINLGFNIHVGL